MRVRPVWERVVSHGGARGVTNVAKSRGEAIEVRRVEGWRKSAESRAGAMRGGSGRGMRTMVTRIGRRGEVWVLVGVEGGRGFDPGGRGIRNVDGDSKRWEITCGSALKGSGECNLALSVKKVQEPPTLEDTGAGYQRRIERLKRTRSGGDGVEAERRPGPELTENTV
jgi:hypothetical protein